MFRKGVTLFTSIGKVVSKLLRLLSGASYTSGMNWGTSRFLWHRIRKWLGLKPHEFIAICEGDDNIGVICGKAFRRLCLVSVLDELFIEQAGLACGKRLKIEAMGWFGDRTAWPAVGGKIVHCDGVWHFMPSLERGVIKAGWAINHNWVSYKVMAGRVAARAWALNDRYSGVPIFWAYARVVAGYAAHLGGVPLFDEDELYKKDEYGWTGRLAEAPTDAARIAYEVAYGVGWHSQLLMEAELLQALREKDFTRDLTREFADLTRR